MSDLPINNGQPPAEVPLPDPEGPIETSDAAPGTYLENVQAATPENSEIGAPGNASVEPVATETPSLTSAANGAAPPAPKKRRTQAAAPPATSRAASPAPPLPKKRRTKTAAAPGAPGEPGAVAATPPKKRRASTPASATEPPPQFTVNPSPAESGVTSPVSSTPVVPAPSALYADSSSSATPSGEIPIAGSTIASLYEAELEIRSLADKSSGQNADLGRVAAGALKLINDNLRRMTEEQADKVTAMLRGIDLKDYLDPDFWKGIGMVLRYQIDEQVSFVKRRLNGQYATDPYGMDRELIEVVRPFLNFMYRTWWRITATGVENVPAEGRALLVGNHSGVLPWDGAMIAVAVAEDHPSRIDRVVRSLHLHWFSTLPFVAPTLAALGQVPGLPENAVRLLENDELVCVFPEGIKGVGKLYKDRYKLARFGRGGFVQAAIRARAPIVPVAVVGAEEIYPMLANAEPVAKLLGMPYFPITPFFPWLGPLGVIPLPTHWSITFCEPLRTDMYDAGEADDPLTVLGLSEMVRNIIQEAIDAKLVLRKSVF